MGGRAGRGGGRTRGHSGEQGDGRIDGQCGQVGDGSRGCTYKECLACNPKEYDGKGGAIVYTRWIEKMELLRGETLKSTRGREATVGMPWEDFKTLTREEFCPSNEMKKLETELWNHAMVGGGHAAYTDRFHELARLVPHLVTQKELKTIQKAIQIAGTLTDEAFRNGSIENNPERRGNGGEPSKDRNVRDDNKRTRTRNAFATTAYLGGKELRFIGERPEEKIRHLRSARTKEQKQEEIVVVKDYLKVFLDGLSGSPPNREIKFHIELVPRAILVVKSPYRLTPSEMEELSGQLKEL
nr:hypothetical protein [Tanacetum cinerariifolium]